MPRRLRHIWAASLWQRLSWGLAFTPMVFVVLVSVDLGTAFAVALVFAPELFAIVFLAAGLFLLSRWLLNMLRHQGRAAQGPRA